MKATAATRFGPLIKLRKRVATAIRPPVRWLSRQVVRAELFRLYARRSPPAEPSNRLRIAVCYLIPNLGDCVMVLPLLTALREDNPDAEISIFAAGGGTLLGMHPAIDRFHLLPPRRGWLDEFHPVNEVWRIWRWWRNDLRALRFDVCVTLRGGVDPSHSAYLAWLLGGRERIGYRSDLEPELGRHSLGSAPLMTREAGHGDGIHETLRGAEVLSLAGLLRHPVAIDRADPTVSALAVSAEALEFLNKWPELTRPYAAIAPGSSVGRRRWPASAFAQLTEREIVGRGWLPVLVGGPEAHNLCAEVASGLSMPACNLAGATSVPALAGVVAGAICFIGNDSGTGHVAGASGTPCLIVAAFREGGPIWHTSNPERTRPLGPCVEIVRPPSQLPPCEGECTANHPHCIAQVTVEAMQEAFARLLRCAASSTRRGARRMESATELIE